MPQIDGDALNLKLKRSNYCAVDSPSPPEKYTARCGTDEYRCPFVRAQWQDKDTIEQYQLMEQIFAGNSEMAVLMRSHHWSETPLGAPSSWSQSLKTVLSILLTSQHPIFLWWGKELIQFYNDAYRPILGTTKHPIALGQRGRECWQEIWDAIAPSIEAVMERGESTRTSDGLLLLDRHGYLEECYFNYAYSPVRDETGKVGGIFCACDETTKRVLGDRQLKTLREIAAQPWEAKTAAEACQFCMNAIANNPADIPFALLYQIDDAGEFARLMGTASIAPGTIASPEQIDLATGGGWALNRVRPRGQPEYLTDLRARFDWLPETIWNVPPEEALILPLNLSGQQQTGSFLILAVSPRRAFDDEYRGFFQVVANQVETAIARALHRDEERKQAEALAELDRAKTEFFSNVSHEFRTPLTLMLSPLADTIAALDGTIPPQESEQLLMVQRNGVRLLKLVNSLLDFSRIEAGRVNAAYEPVDLAAYTAELASTFRSPVERAGMSLIVECPPLPEAIYIDREMWEKIVFNLLSNAFKFTLSGSITVRLQELESGVELSIADTGAGIPPAELPHLFERFHRVKNSQGRSFEGSGIGLSLVLSLVKLHGGAIEVESTFGQGSCFRVTIPSGTAHLPPAQISASRAPAPTTLGAIPYIEEAERWLPEGRRKKEEGRRKKEEATDAQCPMPDAPCPMPNILLADDNADLRDYIRRLLGGAYIVQTVTDGAAAWKAIRNNPPDLVLTDVMMPGMDGFELLRSLRSDPQTQAIPIILLSALSGETARIEGLAAGADDYIIKPFSARELLARVEATLQLSQLRQQALQREQALRAASETAQQQAETAFRRIDRLLESMTEAFIALDRDWRIVYQNAISERINNKPRSEVLGKTLWEEWPAAVGSISDEQYHRALAEQMPVHFEQHYYEPPDHDVWLEVHAYPFEEGLGIFYRDISDRKLADRSRERFLAVGSDLQVITGINGYFQWVSPTFERALGWTQEEMTSRPWTEFIHPEDLSLSMAEADSVFGGNETFSFENRYRHKDGSYRWLLWNAQPYPEEQVVYGAAVDITDRKKAEVALRESEEQTRNILESVTEGFFALDRHWRFTYVNQAAEMLLDRTESDLLGKNIWEEYPGLSGSEFERIYWSAMRDRTAAFMTSFYPDHDRTYEVHTYPAAQGITVYFRNVSEQMQAAAALRQSQERYRTLFESIDEGFCIIEMLFDSNDEPIDYRFREINPVFEQQTGLREATGKTVRQLIPDLENHWLETYGRVALTGEPVRFENGSAAMNRWFDVYACRIGEPQARKVAVVFKDISDRKRIEQEREQLLQREQVAREAAERANRIKDEFLAVLSHELRTPLNPILGWSRLLLTGKLDAAKTANALLTIERNVKLQVQLIDDLLDISSILRGKLNLKVTPVDLSFAIGAALETVRLAAEAKSLQIQTEISPDVGLVMGDAGRLQQVIWNILSNAVKFTPSGGRVEIRLSSIEPQNLFLEDGQTSPERGQITNYAQLQVIDTGKGINPDFLPYVFEHFRQEDAAITRQFGGLGLGLAIARQIVEMHGGRIGVESLGEGQGTAFTVELPLLHTANAVEKVTEKTISQSEDFPLANLRLLVVDDEADSRDFVAFVVEQAGAEVTAVSSASEALQRFSTSTFDILVSDIAMPQMNGYDLIREIRQFCGDRGAQIPAIALTAYAGEVDRQQARRAGFQSHLAKPVEPAEIIAIVARLCDRSKAVR